jgi:hypothetical protein
MVTLNAPHVLVSYSKDVVCGLLKEDNQDAAEDDFLSFPQDSDGLPLCTFTVDDKESSKKNFVFLPNEEYTYRIVSDDPGNPSKKRISSAFTIEELSLGTGASATPINWDNNSDSCYFGYSKMSTDNFFGKEIHIIPEYAVYNGSDLHLVVKSGPFQVSLAPNEAKPLQKDPKDGMAMEIDIDEGAGNNSNSSFVASAGPVQVSSVGFRLCPIVGRATADAQDDEVVGSLAIQTTTGSHESHLVVKIGNLDVDAKTNYSGSDGEEAKTTDEQESSSISIFSTEDALQVQMKSSVFQAVLLDSSKPPMEADAKLLYSSRSSQRLPGKAIVSLEVKGVDLELSRQHTKMVKKTQNKGKDKNSSKTKQEIISPVTDDARATEFSAMRMTVNHVTIKDCVTSPTFQNMLSSDGSGNFLELNAGIKGPLTADVVHVTLLQCGLFTADDDETMTKKNKKNGSLTINTSEEFLWAVFDVVGRINRAITSFGQSSTMNNAMSLLAVEDHDTYSPPQSDIICHFSRVAISSFMLDISFKRRPDASRYPDIRDVPAAALINYSMKQLKFSLKNSQLYFAPYETKGIRGPPDNLVDVVSAVYMARLKFKFLKIMTAVRVEDWASLSGRNDEEDTFVAGDVGRSLGMIAGRTVGGAFKLAGTFT